MTATPFVVRPKGNSDWRTTIGSGQEIMSTDATATQFRAETRQGLVDKAEELTWEQGRPGVIVLNRDWNITTFYANGQYWTRNMWTDEHTAPVIVWYEGGLWRLSRGSHKNLDEQETKDLAIESARQWYDNLGLSGIVIRQRDGSFQEFEANFEYWDKFV